VLIRMRAAAANPMDVGIRSGKLKMVTGRSFPRGHGYDFSGVVEAVGPGVTRMDVGDEVFGSAVFKLAGAFAELVVTEERNLMHKPTGLPFEEAATLLTPVMTAYQAVVSKGNLQTGQSLFVHAALGAVGRSAVQIAKARGAEVSGSVRPGSQDQADALGVKNVVPFDFDPLPLRGQFDLVLDSAGKLPLGTARRLLAPGGRVLDIHPTPAKFLRSRMSRDYVVVVAQPDADDMEAIRRYAESGVIRQPIGRIVPLSRAIEALTEQERNPGPKGGRLVITSE